MTQRCHNGKSDPTGSIPPEQQKSCQLEYQIKDILLRKDWSIVLVVLILKQNSGWGLTREYASPELFFGQSFGYSEVSWVWSSCLRNVHWAVPFKTSSDFFHGI